MLACCGVGRKQSYRVSDHRLSRVCHIIALALHHFTHRSHEAPMTRRFVLRSAALAAFALSVSAPTLSAQQKCPATTPGATMPLTYQGGPTVPAITACDLMARLYVY